MKGCVFVDNPAGWKIHYERIERWRKRLECVCRQPSSPAKILDDYAVAFMIMCHHLEDWLHQGGYVGKDCVRCFVKTSFYLSICRDLAVGAKHFEAESRWNPYARRYAQDDDHLTAEGSTGYIDPSELPPTSGELKPGQYVIEVKGRDGDQHCFDLAEFVHGCISEWDAFLEREGLIAD